MTGDRVAIRHPLRYPRPWLQASAAGAAVLVVGVLVAGSDGPLPLDSASSAVPRTQAWLGAAFGVDALGEPLGATLVAAVLIAAMLATRRPRHAVLVVVAQAGVLAAGDLLKLVVGRTIHDGHLSYPSGHTAGLTAFALVLALYLVDLGGLGRRPTVVVVVSGLVAGVVAGWAQVTVEAHYPTDTVGGLFLAFVVVPVGAQVIDAVADHRGRTWGAP